MIGLSVSYLKPCASATYRARDASSSLQHAVNGSHVFSVHLSRQQMRTSSKVHSPQDQDTLLQPDRPQRGNQVVCKTQALSSLTQSV